MRFLAAVAACVIAPLAQGAVFEVNSTTDAVDAALGDGTCATATSTCTLRAAIQEANALAGADLVRLPAGTYALTLAGANEDASASGDLDISSELLIVGAGPDTTIVQGNGADRVFDIGSGAVASLAAVSVRGGGGVDLGGGIRNAGALAIEACRVEQNGGEGSLAVRLGGGIANTGTLAITGCALRDNQAGASSGQRAIGAQGGALYNLLITAINASRIENNRVVGAASGGNAGGGVFMNSPAVTQIAISHLQGNSAPQGGAIAMLGGELLLNASALLQNASTNDGGALRLAGGTATAVNATFSGNTANAHGGAIALAAGSADLRNVTITQNQANADAAGSGDGGGVYLSSGTLSARNSLVHGNLDAGSGNRHVDCSGAMSSVGYLWLGDATGCVLTAGEGDQVGVDPLLGALADNGGATLSHALPIGSPAIDAGNPAGCLGTQDLPLRLDQRQRLRPVDGNGDGSARCDVGAFELIPQQIFPSGFEATEARLP